MRHCRLIPFLPVTLLLLTSRLAFPQEAAPPRKPAAEKQAAAPADAAKTPATGNPKDALPEPTLKDVPYGTHERQVLDFYKVDSRTPTALVLCIHGGGWKGGDKSHGHRIPNMGKILAAGISCVSINYRYVQQGQEAGAKPPVSWPLHDAARALQFVRSKAAEWNIDKTRIGATGGSAGACSSLWLAFHDDLADPQSNDPVSRESTRLSCAAVNGAQTTLDPAQMKAWTPNSKYGGHAFGFLGDPSKKLSQFDEFLQQRETILPWIAEYSPYALVTGDDPPIYLNYVAPPALGEEQKDPTHTANFGVKLKEKLDSTGVPCELVYPGAPNVEHAQEYLYLIDTLKGK